jgi:hypothetical protein
MKGTLSEAVKVVHSVLPVAVSVAASQAGAAVDRKGFEEALAVVSVSDLSATGPLDVKIQEAIEDPASAGNPLSSDWSDITGAAFTQFVNTTNENKTVVGRINLTNRRKRFLRANWTGSGSSPTGSFAILFILGEASETPVSQTNAVAFNV